MILKLKGENLKRIDSISSYDNNYYWLPFEINNCNVLHESFDECSNEYQYSIGFKINNYEPMFYFEPVVSEFIIDLNTMNKECIWC